MTTRYDAVADSYAASEDDYTGSAVSAVLELVGLKPGPRALDLACGHGLVARELARLGAQVTGIDVSPQLLARARSWNTDPELRIEYVLGDATHSSVLQDAEFDLVVSNFGLSDIDDLDGVCQTVGRVLVPRGRFIFSILHPCFAGAQGVSGSWPSGGSYYQEGFWRADGELSVLRRQVGANHRMLSTYISTLVRHGLAIDTVVEPRPEPEWASTRPGASSQPVYLVLQCIRQAETA